MTKPRAPLSFSKAIDCAAGLIGFDRAAKLVDRAERTVRLWGESDAGGSCSLDQALALDLAYRAAGGTGAPIFESYARQLEVAIAEATASAAALAVAIGDVATEAAQAVAAGAAIIIPGTSPTGVHRALAEAEDASGAIARLICRLKGFLPGKSAGEAGGGDRRGS